MAILPAVSGTFLLLNLLGAGIALAFGFAAGAWFMCARSAAASDAWNSEEARKAADRALMASTRLVDLAHGVADDVGDHTSKMKSISAGLKSIDRHSKGAGAEIAAALDQILVANSELHARLENAEKQIEVQAAEIRVHESEARTDSLTSLANRRAFDDELRRRLSEWHRKKTPFSLLLVDIDRFKRFNDLHGHQIGDEVLRQVAKVLVAQSREMDVPCRYGGEEFAVVLPSTNVVDACIVAERMRKTIEQSTTKCYGRPLNVTASMGLAMVATDEDAVGLIRRADEALYKSKEAGRNCGHWHDHSRCVPIVPTEPGEATPTVVAKEVEPPESVPRVASRTTFIHELKRRAIECHRFGVPVSTIHLKLDGYDRVAQSMGRAGAKQMLGRATQALESSLRETDILAQHVHGEFVIMLPGSTEAEAHQMAKRMKIAISNHVVELVNGQLPLNFRHGIAQLKIGETAQEMLARGRQSMLVASVAENAMHA